MNSLKFCLIAIYVETWLFLFKKKKKRVVNCYCALLSFRKQLKGCEERALLHWLLVCTTYIVGAWDSLNHLTNMNLERGKIIEWGKGNGEWETSNKLLLLLYCLYFTRTCYCNSKRRNLNCSQVNSKIDLIW